MDAIRSGFSVRQLFSAGEVGVWYDPSDLTTMFQDAAGTTPVTAVEQPVGLILDKSKGLVLGPELVTNGGFDSDTAWNKGAGVVIAGGVAQFPLGTETTINQTMSFSSGKYHVVTLSVSGATASGCRVRFNGSSATAFSVFTGNGNFKTIIFAPVGTTTFEIFSVASTFNGAIDNISVRELPGAHAVQATSTKRGTAKATGAAKWIDYDAVDDVLNTTFPSSLGAACTVAIANVGAPPTILTAQTIGTSYAMSTDNAGLIIVNRALTAGETASLTAYMTAKGAS